MQESLALNYMQALWSQCLHCIRLEPPFTPQLQFVRLGGFSVLKILKFSLSNSTITPSHISVIALIIITCHYPLFAAFMHVIIN